MARYVFDNESTEIPKDPRAYPDKLWCIVARDLDNRGQQLVAKWENGLTKEQAATDPLFQRCIDRLFSAPELVGHNIAGSDIPHLEYLSGRRYRGKIFDTFAVSHLLFIHTLSGLTAAISRQRRDPELMGYGMEHSLKAWGMRLGIHKKWADVDVTFFSAYSTEMLDRCKSDVAVNEALYDFLLRAGCTAKAKPTPVEVFHIESEFSYWMDQQRRSGIALDMAGLDSLDQDLRVAKLEAETAVRQSIPTYLAKNGKEVVPKKDRRMKPTEARPWPVFYTEGAVYQKVDLEDFNPGSDPQLAKTLLRLGWEPDPDEITEGGQPQVEDEILADLEPFYPWLAHVRAYRSARKLLGQASDGAKSWRTMSTTREGGKATLHGRVKNVGCRTSRCSHSDPNLGQVPKPKNKAEVKDPNSRGNRCRALFSPHQPGWFQVGWDASQLELKMLANRLFPYDKGAFDVLISKGDMHTEWMQYTGLHFRENQKTFIYAFFYGAQGKKLGLTVLVDLMAYAKANPHLNVRVPPRTFQKALGERAREGILGQCPALASLLEDLLVTYERQGWIELLDGAVIKMGSEHSRLNDLLQGDGARVMKWATVLFSRKMEAQWGEHWLPWRPAAQWALMANVHDEQQTACATREIAEWAAVAGPQSIIEAAGRLNVKVELKGDSKIGRNWAECH